MGTRVRSPSRYLRAGAFGARVTLRVGAHKRDLVSVTVRAQERALVVGQEKAQA